MTRLPVVNRIRAILGHSHRQTTYRLRQKFIERARTACRFSQQAVLQDLLQLNSGSHFARDFGLQPGMSLTEFRKRVPISGYELFQPYVERVRHGEVNALLGAKNRLLMLAVTSGTTAKSKLIPVTDRFVNDYRRGWQAWGIGAYFAHPAMQKLNIVQITSSHRRFVSPAGIPCGNISGLVASMQGAIVKSLYTVPSEIADIEDACSKRYTVLRCALADPFVGMLITANPSTVLQMLDYLQVRATDLIRDIRTGELSAPTVTPQLKATLRGRLKANPVRATQLQRLLDQKGVLSPSDFWPHLTTLGVWCGGSAGAYIPQLRSSFPGVAIRDHGLHASEGRMTMPLEDESAAGVLEVLTHFFEFLPVREADSPSPVTLEAHELEPGQEYFILLTTSSGLYRYNIQDVVLCVGYLGETPLLEFRHKGAHISSITGEKIAESQVVEAVQAAACELELQLRLFTLTPDWGDPPGYTLFVQHADSCKAGRTDESAFSDRLQLLADRTDRNLRRLNVEYQEKRDTQRLRSIRCQILPAEAWERFHAARTNSLGGSIEQYKHPCLLPDPQFQRLFQRACSINEVAAGSLLQ